MKRASIPAVALAVALLALALGLSACGEKSEDVTGETESLTLTLDFFPNPDHVGIYMAQKLGYFKEAGLNVNLQTPSDPAAPIKLVATGRSDLAISYEPEVLLAHEQGLDVQAVAALVNRPLTSMIWLKKSRIGGVGGLRGKTIATAGIPYQDAYLKTILARAKLKPSDVTAVNVGFGLLPALLGGRAQAMLGGFSNIEGVDLRLRGKEPIVTPVDKLGVPTYDELVLVAQRKRLEEDPQAIRLFIAALARGTAAAASNPKAAAKTLLEANPDLDPKLTKAELAVTLPLLAPAPGDQRPYGYMAPGQWREFTGWMRDNELIDGLPATSDLLSNDYLPGAIPE
ncbi:MAG: putative hydroxymethylpyrimidine transport system substrate-binding protein [Solirubrobacterales bacterium]|jgi:putative hydroxymethylpyrimidine transport system substrate-binding protein|nr:putative hydroxymethylpyrimidine transport system substrate-binding protein [Solirubrobacterales bacterium]